MNHLKDGIITEEFHNNIRRNLEQIAVAPSRYQAVWHPVGFIHVNLGESDASNLRLHVWTSIPKEYRGLGWQIHDHTWRLTSYVICGRVRNLIYAINPSPVIATHRIYDVKYDGRINYLEASNEQITYEILKEEIMSQGNTYTVETKAFHSSEVEENTLAATLVLAEKTQLKSPRVIGDLNGQKTYIMERHICADHILKDEVTKILQVL